MGAQHTNPTAKCQVSRKPGLWPGDYSDVEFDNWHLALERRETRFRAQRDAAPSGRGPRLNPAFGSVTVQPPLRLAASIRF
jgi:hypothetical protein